jgi:hypothetical protein
VALTLGAAVLVRRLDGRTARHRAVARVDLTRAGPAPVTAER